MTAVVVDEGLALTRVQSVGCLGGWMQGGGHGPAAHDFGLGADQVLEARVVLANGRIVTASACQHQDLFFAIRGGGPSTYGVVVSTIVKAHPTTRVAAQQLSFSPRTAKDVPAFMDALTVLYTSYPDLSDLGFSGYGSWELTAPPPNPAGYRHAFAILDQTSTELERRFQPFKARLDVYRSQLKIDIVYSDYPKFVDYYNALSGIQSPVGQAAALGSRLLDRKALTADPAALKKTLQTIVGPPEQFTSINVVFTTGGQIFRDAADPYSGVNPPWRRAYLHNIIARGWAPGTNKTVQDAIQDDVMFTKLQALKTLAPDMGAYMNEVTHFFLFFLSLSPFHTIHPSNPFFQFILHPRLPTTSTNLPPPFFYPLLLLLFFLLFFFVPSVHLSSFSPHFLIIRNTHPHT